MSESKDLLTVLWSGADVLRGKMDANEYKTYLLGFVFYKYLSDAYLDKAYDLINDEKAPDMETALEAYKEAVASDDAEDLLAELKDTLHYTLEPQTTFTQMIADVADNSFHRENLKAGFNSIESSDKVFEQLFDDVDLYSNRLGTNDKKQTDTIADLIKALKDADLIHAEGDVLGNAYEYLIGQFASEPDCHAGTGGEEGAAGLRSLHGIRVITSQLQELFQRA